MALASLSFLVILALAVPDGFPDFDRLWDYAHPAQTEAAFRQLLPRARETGDPSLLAQLLSQIARAEGLQGRFSEAQHTLDQAEAQLTPKTKRAKIRCLLERGRLFNSAGSPDRARPLFVQAWELARAAGEDSLAIDAAHMLGIIEPPDQALEWDRKALAVAESSPHAEVKGWLAPLYNNTGWSYFERGDYPAALDLLQKALKWHEAGKDPRAIRIARYGVGRVLRAMGRYPEALRLQEQARRDGEAIGDRPGYVYEELGECYLTLKQPDVARHFFGLAYDVLSKDPDLVKNQPQRLQRLHDMGMK